MKLCRFGTGGANRLRRHRRGKLIQLFFEHLGLLGHQFFKMLALSVAFLSFGFTLFVFFLGQFSFSFSLAS